MLLDVVILPPAGLRRTIGKRIRKETSGYPAGFVIDNKKFIPHLSLWHLRSSPGRIAGLMGELRKVARDQKPFTIRSAGFHVSKMNTGTVVEFAARKSAPLAALQKRVFSRTYPFKTGMVLPFKPFGAWSGKALAQARKYGRPIGFGPHFTMGWLKNTDDALVVQRTMRKTRFSFVAKEFYLCEVNRWWQVTGIIKKIGFGRK